MQNLLDIDQNDYAFEAAQEVRDVIEKTENLHELIMEEKVRDLHYVDVTGRAYCKVKRALDVLLSFLALVVLLIPMAIISLIVYIDDPGKIIFSQNRVGLHGKRFKLYKFRTMKSETPKYLSTMDMKNPDQFITRVGRVLRKVSLDELPQLYNVLRGDMSLIGPRPLISDEYEIHAMRMRFGVYNVRPGITGLAQINGRDLVSPEEKVRWDVKYLENFGFPGDLKILFGTVPKILGAAGVVEGYDASHQTGKEQGVPRN